MPNWKTRTLLFIFGLMVISSACQAQNGAPATAASAASTMPLRHDTPSPYSPPVAVPSAAGQIQPPRLPSPSITVTPAPTPSFSSNCDGSGCWGSDGTRYNLIGGALVRPDGRTCQNVGGVMSCP
jgi:hypothetical protein